MKPGVANVFDGNERMTESEEETAEALNQYFQSVFTEEDPNRVLPRFPKRTEMTISDIIVTEENVEKELGEINVNKATVPDRVEGRLLRGP